MNKKNILLILFVITAMVSACSGELFSLSKDNNTNSNNNNNVGNITTSKVTVWFDTQQSSISNWYQTIDSGSVLAKPDDLSLENYTFLGWYDSNVSGSLWDFSKPVTKDMTLYAMWEKNGGAAPEVPVVYTIEYNNGGMGGYVASIQLQNGTTLYESHLPVLYADGYNFLGWYYNDTKVIAGQFKVTANITLTAKWVVSDNGDTTPPAEVTDLKVSLDNNKVVLTWVNPSDEDFKSVIISYIGDNSLASFGGHVSTGAGKADSYRDTKTLYNASAYTFTVQTVDYNGNKSQGVSVKLDGSTVEPAPEPEPEPEPNPNPNPGTGYPKYKNQTKWFYGINGPLPTDSAWHVPGVDRAWELVWKEEYGWYDVNKTHLVDKERENTVIAKDNELCWAATASNILHWWFRLNEKYIKKYDEINPDKAKNRPNSAYPLQGTTHVGGSIYQESEIFQYFIDHFKDEAGWGDSGVNWYISGYKVTSPEMIKQSDAGFFSDVFPNGKYVATHATGISKTRFTEIIIDAVENHKALGIARQAGSSHLMTIWGAEFDENGYVKAVYIADNNVEQTTEPYYKDLTRRLVKYSTIPGTTATQAEVSAFGIDSYSPVVSLIIVDLGVKHWEDYFKSKGITIE